MRQHDAPTSDITTLRRLMPQRALTFHEALQRAELQAARLLELHQITDGPVPDHVIADQPRLRIEYNHTLNDSGYSTWARGSWRIQLNALEPLARQRFTLAHEYKHILDAPLEAATYARLRSTGERQPLIEQICDYFAACLLMPKPMVKRAWGQGLNDAQALADYFDVSSQAMHIRLQTLGLIERPSRCRAPHALPTDPDKIRPRTYRRAASASLSGALP